MTLDKYLYSYTSEWSYIVIPIDTIPGSKDDEARAELLRSSLTSLFSCSLSLTNSSNCSCGTRQTLMASTRKHFYIQRQRIIQKMGALLNIHTCACLSWVWLISSCTRPWLSSWCNLSMSWTCCRYWWWSCSRSDTRDWYPAEYCCKWATSWSLCARRPWVSWLFTSS